MPNWIRNKIIVERDFHQICEFVKSDTCLFDFNRIVPMPVELDIHQSPLPLGWTEGETNLEHLNKSLKLTSKYRFDNWYDYWVIKWGACNPMTILPNEQAFVFKTAWAPAYKIVSILSEKFPDILFVLKYATEFHDQDCGIYDIKNGKIVKTVFDAFELAKELFTEDELDIDDDEEKHESKN